MKNALKKYLKKKIVVDTSSSWIYIGNLKNIGENSIELTDVDVHDSKDTTTTKEIYLVRSKETGIKSNRENVFINLDYIVSFSPFDKVKQF
ncbi:MAG: hypothetical protein ABFR75_00500 [Acidobacteriota bacterium]